jgi:hypothetical protein
MRWVVTGMGRRLVVEHAADARQARPGVLRGPTGSRTVGRPADGPRSPRSARVPGRGGARDAVHVEDPPGALDDDGTGHNGTGHDGSGYEDSGYDDRSEGDAA